MKEEKDMECKHCPVHCGSECCCGGMHHHGGKAHIFILIGTLALVYAGANYLRMYYSWPPYAGWTTGGIFLILFGMAKKHWTMKKT